MRFNPRLALIKDLRNWAPLYTYSQKVWAENSVLFESFRGLIFLTTDIIIIMRVLLVTKIDKFVHIEMFNAVENTPKLLLV